MIGVGTPHSTISMHWCWPVIMLYSKSCQHFIDFQRGQIVEFDISDSLDLIFLIP